MLLAKTASESSKGFSLIIAMMLMGFILLLLLSLSSLVRLETSASIRSNHLQESRQYALMGLSIAMAELQKTAGPDQRVTAKAEILDGNGRVIAPGMRHVTGVWDSTAYDPAAARIGDTLDPITWLLSYPEDGGSTIDVTQSLDDQLSATQIVTLVGENTVGSAANPDLEINAGLVPIRLSDDSLMGNYAYWVSDEGVKARLFLPSESTTSAVVSDRASSLQRLGGALTPQPTAMSGLEDMAVSDKDVNAVSTFEQLQVFSSLNAAEKRALKERFHDVTLESRGLLTNTKTGGFKKDLSLAFEMDDAVFNADAAFSGLRSNLSEPFTYRPIFTTPGTDGDNIEGPTWHLLRNYYRLYRDIDWSSAGNPVIDARVYSPSTQAMRDANGGQHFAYDMSRYYSGRSAPGAALFTDKPGGYQQGSYPVKRTAPAVTPVVARMQYVFSLGVQPLEAGDPVPAGENAADFQKLSLIFDRILVIWNPYNVPVRFIGISSWYNQGSVPIDIHLRSRSPGNELLVKVDDASTLLFEDTDRFSWLPAGAITIPAPMNPVSSTGSFLTDADNRIMQPGELRILSASDVQPNNQDSVDSRILTEGFNSVGGIRVPLSFTQRKDVLDANGQPVLDEDGQPRFEDIDYLVYIKAGGEIQARLEGNAYQPGDLTIIGRMQAEHHLIEDSSATISELQVFNDNNGLRSYSKSSSISTFEFNLEQVDTDADYTGWSAPIVFGDTEKIGFGLLDIHLKPGALQGDPAVMGDYAPAVASVTQTYMHDQGYLGVPPNWTFKVENIADLTDVIESSFDGRLAFWGDTIEPAGGVHYVSLYEVPLAPLQSLGSLRHAPLSVVSEQPMHPFGSSRAHPAMSQDQLVESLASWENYSYDFFDLSYLSNTAIWDDYFFSSIAPRQIGFYSPAEQRNLNEILNDLYDDPGLGSLPNAGYRLGATPFSSSNELVSDLLLGGNPRPDAYKRVARYLEVDGMFNVNSTSVQAWATLLTGIRNQRVETLSLDGDFATDSSAGIADTVFSRVRLPNGNDADKWSGFNTLTDDAIWSDNQTPDDESDDSGLAFEIVEQIKQRGPFLNLADFVNRRLRDDELGEKGALQAAIDLSGVNNAVTRQVVSSDLPSGIRNDDAAEGPQSLGAPGVLDQGDLLTQLGPYLTVRSDTFKIRVYGESVDPLSGEVRSRSWGEAIVQRTAQPVNPGAGGPLADTYWDPQDEFGRRFEIVSFKWLNQDDV